MTPPATPPVGSPVGGLNILLRGVVGSRAYGLDHATSDIDRMAVYAAPTRQLLGLGPAPEAITTSQPDVVTFELARFLQLALGSNPQVMELLWLPAGLYETTTMLGMELVRLRQAFLSEPGVHHAYLGCAKRLMEKLKMVNKAEDGKAKRQRLAKTARHLARHLRQGLHLYATGRLLVRLDADVAEQCRAVGIRAANGELYPAEQMIREYEQRFADTPSPLPAYPDRQQVDAWLRRARVRLLAVPGPDVHPHRHTSGHTRQHGGTS
jgi:uncharacterized protein